MCGLCLRCGQVNDLRKQWAQEFQKRSEEDTQQKLYVWLAVQCCDAACIFLTCFACFAGAGDVSVERVHIQLRQAERLRERRRVRAERAEEYKKQREEQYQRWRCVRVLLFGWSGCRKRTAHPPPQPCRDARVHREHVAQQQIRWAEQHQLKQQTYANMVKELENESNVWITQDNMDKLLTPEFFGDSLRTTGLHTRFSDNLRYTMHVWNAKRPVEGAAEEAEDDYRGLTDRLEAMSITDQLEALAGEYLAQRQQVASFLEDIIDNGRDREHFHEITQALVDVMQRDGPASAIFDEEEEDDMTSTSWRDKGYYDEDVELGTVRKDRMQASRRVNARLLRQEAARASEDEDVDTVDVEDDAVDVDDPGVLLPEDVIPDDQPKGRGKKSKK